MPDLRSYAAELEREIVPPALAELERVATRRARLRATTSLAAAALSVAGLLLALGPGRTTDRTLPADIPTPTVTGIDGLLSLTPEQIGALAGEETEDVTTGRDGHPAVVREATLCFDNTAGTLTRSRNGAETCRTAWKFTNGERHLWTPAGGGTVPTYPQYVGDGTYVHAPWGDPRVRPYVVDTDTMVLTELEQDATSGRPAPGRHLVTCGHSHLACVVDVGARRLGLLTHESAPGWISELSSNRWTFPVVPIGTANDGPYVLPDGLGTGSASSNAPLLVSQAMSRAVLLTNAPAVAPEPGLSWVANSTGYLHVVDSDRLTISRIQLPPNVTWSHNTSDGFWGLRALSGTEAATTYTAVHVDARGMQTTHDLAVEDPESVVQLAEDGITRAMAYYVISRGDSPNLLHVSTDRGTTWRILTVPAAAKDSIQNGYLLPTWESWPEVG